MFAFTALVLARLLIPLLIPRFPLPVTVLVLVIDAGDQSVFQLLGTQAPVDYQSIDKALDIYYLTIVYASTIRNWGGGFAFKLGRALWYYRLLGVTLFEYVGARWLLFLFPNTFEYYFIVIEALKVARNPLSFTRTRLMCVAAFIWIFIKLPQEWWLHVGQLDLTDLIKQQVFAISVNGSWREAFGNRPHVAALLFTIAVALAAMTLRWYRSRPTPPMFSADAQVQRAGWFITERQRSTRFGRSFVEKLVLVTLVTLIFHHILPGRYSILQVAVGTAAVITATTSISHWLAFRGFAVQSIPVRFVAMAATNIAIGVAVVSLLASPGTRPSVPTFLFLINLLTLIVLVFDEFQRNQWRAPSSKRAARLIE